MHASVRSVAAAVGCSRCHIFACNHKLTVAALLRWLPSSSLHLLRTVHAPSSILTSAWRPSLHRSLSTLPNRRSDSEPTLPTEAPSASDAPSPSTFPWSTSPLSLAELRSMLQHVIPSTATLLSLVQHVRSQPGLVSLLGPSDYSLLCHQLSLHNAAHSDYRALTCLLLMDVYDEYCIRERNDSDNGWGEGWRHELMADALSVCSRTGEGKGCEFVVAGMAFYGVPLTAHEMNAVLWGLRRDRYHQWRWYDVMKELSRAMAAGQEPAERDSRTLSLYYALKAGHTRSAAGSSSSHGSHWRPDSTTVLILMHSCLLVVEPPDGRYTRLDSGVLRRLTTAAFHLPAADPHTAQLLNQLISLSSVIDRDQPQRFSRRVHALFRMANELRCPLTERSLRLAMGAAHILQHRRQTHSLTTSGSETNDQPAAAAAATVEERSSDASVEPSWSAVLQSDPDGAQFAADVLAAFQQSGVSVGQSSALIFDMHATGSAAWQRVLELFDWVQREGGHIDMQRALTAIEACYKGKHWQRALDILVLPKWAKGFVHVDVSSKGDDALRATNRKRKDKAAGGHTPVRAAHEAEAAISAQPVTSSEPIEWQANKRRWSGPQYDQLVWLTELSNEPWLMSAASSERSRRETAVPSPPAHEVVSAASGIAALPLAPLSYPATILHFAYAIAAMDDAGNAEALLKADRLHMTALRLLPFLGALYQYDSNTIHLHHPLTPLNTVNSFLQQPRNQHAKLFALLYLVWRMMRRHFVDYSTPLELFRLSALYGSRGDGRWGVTSRAKSVRREPLRFRVADEAEAHILQRLLAQPPFELRARADGQIGVIKRYKLHELAGSAAKQDQKQPVERQWWNAMHSAQRMDQEVVALEVPSQMWYAVLQSKEEDDDQ